MVLPITGPFIVEEPDGSYTKKWYRQRRPYDRPLEFVNNRGIPLGPGNFADGWRWKIFARDGVSYTAIYAQAYSKLVDQLGESAGQGVTLAQWKQADAMISRRANQLTAFTVALAKRSPVGVAASLGISLREVQRIMRTRYGVARSLSDLWLEFWFGWKPMLMDIYAACEVFDRELPWGKLRASRSYTVPMVVYQVPATIYGEGIAWEVTKARVAIGVDVRLKNANVHLLNQLGLLNPAVVAFDVIPWSFLLGWVSNVDSWLKSITDFAGIETSNGYVSKSCVIAGSTFWGYAPELGGAAIGTATNRVLFTEVPRPRLVLKGLSLKPARALTAISLLTQKLPRA